jgi:hypothetical protein
MTTVLAYLDPGSGSMILQVLAGGLAAYLDPGSGSMLLQVLAGGLAAVAVGAKRYRHRLARFLRIRMDARSRQDLEGRSCHGEEGAAAGSGPRTDVDFRQPASDTQPPILEPGSFRDPDSRVFYAGDAVHGALSREGLHDFRALQESGLLDDPRTVATELLKDGREFPSPLVKETAGVLRHEPIPFVSYPYEWTFSVLKDAALLQLEDSSATSCSRTRPRTTSSRS